MIFFLRYIKSDEAIWDKFVSDSNNGTIFHLRCLGKFDIKVWPGAGKVKDRTLIADFTGEIADKLGGFPVNSPDCTVQEQSVNTLGRIL